MADHRVRVCGQFVSKLQHCQIKCQECGRSVILPPKVAVATFGAGTLIGMLERRLKCRHCGAKRAWVSGIYREHHG